MDKCKDVMSYRFVRRGFSLTTITYNGTQDAFKHAIAKFAHAAYVFRLIQIHNYNLTSLASSLARSAQSLFP